MKISYHKDAKVKLTDEGIRLYKLIHGHKPPINEDGFYEEPLWILIHVFGPYIKENPDIFEDRCFYMDEGTNEKLQLNKVDIAQPLKDDFDDLVPSWYIYTDEDGIPHYPTFDCDVEANQFFEDVSNQIAFGDCSGVTVQKIYFKGKEVEYVGWQPGMKFQYKDLDGNTVWVGNFLEWDH